MTRMRPHMIQMRQTKLYAFLFLAIAMLLPAIATAQICPINTAAELPTQAGHPWTKLASCVTDGNAVVGGMVGNTDCTNAYIGSLQSFVGANALGTVTVKSGGTLVFLNQNYPIQVGSFTVESGGTLQIGAKACPIQAPNQVRIFYSGGEGSTKGIDVKSGGTLRMWGKRGNTELGNISWAHLLKPAGPLSYSKQNKVASPVTTDAFTVSRG